MVRETVGTGAGAGALVDVAKVCVVDGEVVWVCADTIAAAAKKMTARDSFFTLVLDLGEIEISNLLYGAGLTGECKEQEGMGLW